MTPPKGSHFLSPLSPGDLLPLTEASWDLRRRVPNRRPGVEMPLLRSSDSVPGMRNPSSWGEGKPTLDSRGWGLAAERFPRSPCRADALSFQLLRPAEFVRIALL